MKIYTNKHNRQFKYRSEVPEKILADDFNWLNEDNGFDGFIYYRDRWYHLSEFMRIENNSPFDKYWQGYISDSFFSGVLIRFNDDGETYQIATYIS